MESKNPHLAPVRVVKEHGIEVPIYDTDVGVSCSGGADSSMLLYLLMKHYKDTDVTIHIFTCVAKSKNMPVTQASANVIRKCVDLTGNNNIRHYVNYVDMNNAEMSVHSIYFDWVMEYKKRGDFGMFYTGITRNPPESVTDQFKWTTNWPNGAQTERDPNLVRPIVAEFWVSIFTNTDKVGLCDVYEGEGVLDTLFPETRSCESTDPEYWHATGHCGECWWCEERLWGFGRLN